ncbi:MAG TPA: hypothetical protein VF720_06935 [Candidatus Eisenbacteria bacterium]
MTNPPAALTRILIALSFLLAALLACRQLASADLGFHLKTGDYILGGHGWPKTDPFTVTMKGHPYIDTSWGFDVLVTIANKLAGPTGIGILAIFLTLATLTLIGARTIDKTQDGLALGLGLLAAAIAMEMRYEPRPETLSYAFLALQCFLLERRAAGRPTPIWSFVIVQWAWTNTHSLFVIGWLAIAIFLVGGWLERRKIDRQLALGLLASMAVAFLNPYGLEGVKFPFTLLTRFQQGNPFAESIGEFISPLSLKLSDQFPFYPVWPIWTFRVLVVLAALAILPLARHRRFTAILLMLAMFPLAAKMIRNIPLFVVVAVPAIIATFPLGQWLTKRRPVFRTAVPVAGILVAIILCLRVYHDAYYLDTRRPDRFGFGWNRFALPVETAAYLNSHDMPGAMLNHLNFGGYLMHATKGPVFIDGRLEVVGESFYNDYLRIFGSEVALEQAVQRNGIGYIVTPYTIAPELIRRVSADPRWTLTHLDNVAAVFVRNDRAGTKDRMSSFVDSKLASQLAAGPPSVSWNQLPGMGGPPRAGKLTRWVGGLSGRQTFPNDEFYVGLFCYLRKEYEAAGRHFTEAIRTSRGDWYDPYANLGAVLWRNNMKPAAEAAYRVVLIEDPDNSVARQRSTGTER